ncbi:unnamed protein product [Brassica oleracea]
MAITRIFFSDLKSGGKYSSVIEARLLRYWESRNLKHGGDLMWVDMLMVDVSATIMQATIYANRIPRFRSKLASGKMYSISGFDVARCAQNYRLSKSPLLIRFNDLTDFDELTEPVSPLPEKGFRFSNQSELAGLANPNAQLPEYCERYSWRQELATIKLDKYSLIFSIFYFADLFDAQAVSFHKKLEDMHGDPRVLVTMDTMSKTRSNEVITNIDLLNELKDGGLTVDAELARLKEMEGDCEESTNKERTR